MRFLLFWPSLSRLASKIPESTKKNTKGFFHVSYKNAYFIAELINVAKKFPKKCITKKVKKIWNFSTFTNDVTILALKISLAT
jgi:hypothetical protein